MQDDLSKSGLPPADEKPAPTALTATAAAWLANAIRRQQRFIGLIEESGVDTTVVINAMVATLDPAVRFVRVANPLVSPLTLTRIILQIGGDQATSPDDEVAGAVRTLTTRVGEERQIVLIIEQADTLQRQALLFLQTLPDLAPPGAPILQVLFVAYSRFWKLLDGEEFSRIREQLGEPIVIDGQAGETADDGFEPPPSPPLPAAASAVAPSLVPISSPPLAGGSGARRWRRSIWAIIALVTLASLVATAGVLMYRGMANGVVALPARQLDPTPPAADNAVAVTGPAPAIPATTSPSAPPAIAEVVPTLNSGTPKPSTADPSPPDPALAEAIPPEVASGNAAAESQDRLHRGFNTFLSRSALNIAHLTDAQRETLFQQYLARQKSPPIRPPRTGAMSSPTSP